MLDLLASFFCCAAMVLETALFAHPLDLPREGGAGRAGGRGVMNTSFNVSLSFCRH